MRNTDLPKTTYAEPGRRHSRRRALDPPVMRRDDSGMFRQRLNPLAAEVALLLLGTMLGIISNFAAGGPGNRWVWLVAIGALMILVVGLQIWQHQAQRAPSR